MSGRKCLLQCLLSILLMQASGRVIHPAALRCFVYERDTGRAIQGVQVIAIGQKESTGAEPNSAMVTVGPAITDANGECKLDILAGGRWQLLALKEGWTPGRAFRVIDIEAISTAPLVVIPLQRMPCISGRIVDGQERPIGNASVSFRVRGNGIELRGYVKTDTNGNYRIWLGPSACIKVGGRIITNTPQQRLTLCSLIVRGDALAKGQYRLEFKAPNYATVVIPEVKFPAGKFTVQLDIRMKRVGGCIRGVVVNRDGKPVSGAEVILRAIGKSQSATKQVQTQLTKKDGSFQFDALREGNYILQVMPDARIVTSSMQIVKVIAGETVSARMTVQMRKEQPIVKIQLLRADGCTPIARTRVRISLRMIYPERRYGASATLTTDAHGRCFMPLRKEPAVYRAYLTFAGWCILKLVDARANKMPEVKVIVPSEPQVICRIKAPNNTLIPGGVYIHLYAGDDLGWENIGSPQEGIMRIAGLLPGNYKLAVTPIATYSYSEYQHARIFPAVEVKISDEQTGTVDVTLSLPRCGTLRGKVLMVKNGHERPLQFANVQLERIDGDSGQLFFATASRNDGSFTFTTIPIGDYKLTVRHTACEETQMRVTVTDKPDNRNSQFVTIRLKYIGLGTIVGRVIDSAGTSVANATVIIRRWDERAERQYQVSSTRTDAQGAFQCAGLRPGRYIIEIITDDGNGTSVDKIIVRGDRTTDVGAVRLPQPSIILGKVTANDESILADLRVVAGRLGFGERLTTYLSYSTRLPTTWLRRVASVGSRGQFKLTVPAGTFELVLFGKPLLLPLTQVITVQPGERKVVKFSIPTPAVIEGRVTRIDTGEPVPMAIVSLHAQNGTRLRQTVTNADGIYRIRNILPGTYSVRCRGENLAVAVRHHVHVDEGDVAIVDFNLSPGASVVGRLVRKGNTPVNWRLYQVLPNADVSLISMVRSDGSFRIEYLPPGRHLIMVFRGSEQVAAKEVVLHEGEEKHIVIEF